MRCKKHPKYQAKRAPTSDCKVCWNMWENRDKSYHWSKEDEAILKKWLKSKNPDRKIVCDVVNKSWGAVEKKLIRMKLDLPKLIKSTTVKTQQKDSKEETMNKITQKEFQAMKKKKTLYEIIGDVIVSAVQKLPVSESEKIPIFTGEPEDEEEMCLMLGDSHVGQFTETKDSGGLGSYNVNIFLKRLEFLKISLAKIFSIHFYNTPYKVINIFFIGDIIENKVMHLSQERLTDLKLVEQVITATDQFSYLIAWLSTIFKEVRIHCIVGNHGRISKDIGHFAPTDSFDYLIYKLMEERLKDHKNVFFNISESWWMIVERMGQRFYLEHGDNFRSWAGIPFYGINRGKANLRDLLHEYYNERAEEVNFDYFLMGHIHEAVDFSNVIVNGAFPGGGEYSLKQLKRGGKAVQRCFSLHPTFGVTWSRKIVLDNPKHKSIIKYYK